MTAASAWGRRWSRLRKHREVTRDERADPTRSRRCGRRRPCISRGAHRSIESSRRRLLPPPRARHRSLRRGDGGSILRRRHAARLRLGSACHRRAAQLGGVRPPGVARVPRVGGTVADQRHGDGDRDPPGCGRGRRVRAPAARARTPRGHRAGVRACTGAPVDHSRPRRRGGGGHAHHRAHFR